MSGGRKNSINLLDLPSEILTHALPNTVKPYLDQTRFIATLSSTCKSISLFFQPALGQRAAQCLLSLVLKPTQANLEKAKKIVTINPKLLFVESVATEFAAGLLAVDTSGNTLRNVHRTVKASPIRAIVGAGDRWLLEELLLTKEFKQYAMSNKSTYALIANEIKKQFPNGFDFPSSTYDFGPLVKAINEDPFLRQGSNLPSKNTNLLVMQFWKHFLPNTIITNGHFFNFNELVKAFEIYDEYLNKKKQWNSKQQSLYWRAVIGYLEGLVTGVLGQVISQGIMNVVNGNPPKRIYDFYNVVTKTEQSYFPLASSMHRLGTTFAVESNLGDWKEDRATMGCGQEAGYNYALDGFKKYVEQHQQFWKGLMLCIEAAAIAEPTAAQTLLDQFFASQKSCKKEKEILHPQPESESDAECNKIDTSFWF